MISITLPQSKPDGMVRYIEQGEGEPLVLLHGVGMQAAAWEPQIRRFAGTHRVIALNLPGHGGSTPLSGDATLPDFVDWLRTTLQAFGCGPVNLAGHSMGALVAGGYVAMHGGLVRRVALLNAVYRRSDEARALVVARAADVANGHLDIAGPLARWFDGGPRDAAARDRAKTWLTKVDPRAYATAYRAFAFGDATYADRWSGVKCPALFLTGSDDPNSTPDMARAMAAAAEIGTACVISGHRHMVNMTAPDAVNKAMQDWLALPEYGQTGGEVYDNPQSARTA